jgi:hypothetical protein
LALSVTPLNLRGQLLERDVILAVAADIATEPGKLLGVGPRPDSAGKIIPHLKLVDTTIACKKGPGTCTGFFPQLQKSIYKQAAERMGAKLHSEHDGPALDEFSNFSGYRFSEVEARADTAEVRVWLVWRDWVSPSNAHVVIALYVLVREEENQWRVVWKGRPDERGESVFTAGF